MAKILVTGGAGYIGSQMTDMLVSEGHKVVVYDNLVGGSRAAVLGAELVVADLADVEALDACFSQHHFDAVMHFAAYIQVNESVLEPAKYYENNLLNGIKLLEVMRKNLVNLLIFSSSAAVFGEPQCIPVAINHPKNPVNPYGKTKAMFEEVLADYDKAYNLKSICLRYFNAAGADPLGRLGSPHKVITHLIPLVLQVASGRREAIEIFGSNYPTADGTCVRDYIHVVDLCRAHMLALHALMHGCESKIYNLGNGRGYSVLEVVKTAEKVTGKRIATIMAPRRVGDPAELVADATLALRELFWRPKYPELEVIIKHAWAWEQLSHYHPIKN